MADPLDAYALESVAFATGRKVVPRLASPSDIEAAMERLYSPNARETATVRPGSSTDDVERLRDLSSDAPVIRLVNSLIARAVEARASDIHFEPAERSLRVRFRVDGVLFDAETLSERLSAPLTSRIKIMAKLRFAVRGKEIDFRVSTMPTLHGESVVLRILDRGSLTLDFNSGASFLNHPPHSFPPAASAVRSRRALHGSGPPTAWPSARKSMIRSVRESYRGHFGRLGPLGSPVRAKFTQ